MAPTDRISESGVASDVVFVSVRLGTIIKELKGLGELSCRACEFQEFALAFALQDFPRFGIGLNADRGRGAWLWHGRRC